MNVFISYSVQDTGLVQSVASSLASRATVEYWDQSKQPGAEIWPTIFQWIDRADLVLVIITGKTLSRAFSVGQEVGHARKAGKRIVPLVANDIPVTELGFLSGITYIALDTSNPAGALQTLQAEVERLDQEARQLEQANKAREEQKSKEAVVALAGLALLVFLFNRD